MFVFYTDGSILKLCRSWRRTSFKRSGSPCRVVFYEGPAYFLITVLRLFRNVLSRYCVVCGEDKGRGTVRGLDAKLADVPSDV